MDIIRYVWKIVDKYRGKYSHVRENSRRRKQIEKGMLTRSNGLRESK